MAEQKKTSVSKELAMDTETKQFISVQIGGERYGIDIGYIDNIVRMQNITRVPHSQTYFKGVINLRGEVVPVLSLRLRMGLEDDVFTNTTRIIILRLTEGMVGVIVDRVNEVVNLSEEDIDRSADNTKRSKDTFINGIGKNSSQLISLLEISAIIDEYA